MTQLSASRLLVCAASIAAACCLAGCGKDENRTGAASKPLDRASFNQRAAERFLPLFWREDANGNGTLDPGELAVLIGFDQDDRSVWIDASGQFTEAFKTAHDQIHRELPLPRDAAERTRRQLVLQELAQGRPTLVENDLTALSPGEKNFVTRMLETAEIIERLYARQKGVYGMDEQIPEDDPASRMLFHRNQSPFCEAPQTENEPACSALPKKPERIVGLYPAKIQSAKDFCSMLEQEPNAAELMGHFSVVVAGDEPGTYRAIPYTEAYRDDMEAIAKSLEDAASGLGEDEAALKNYLLATAKAFRSNDWEPANEAWVAMNAHNSKWYVRIAPDEVYYDPCAWKAGFALQFARINPESIEWQKKLDPMKRDMENRLAEMAGKPYRARNVQFRIPDFIEVILNAGDARSAHGAVIGQSLPNWGPVAEKGGRTVAMTNLYTDVDSQKSQAEQMSAVFCKNTNALATTTPNETLINTLLHEAAHNLGPSHEYAVNGKQDDALFGGPLASTLEELKAQSSALYLTYWLADKGLFSDEEVRKIQTRNVAWAFGHISRGMYAAGGTPRHYSQLSAIQIGSLIEAGAIAWHADQPAANGSDQGCVEVNFEALPKAIEDLETTVLQIKASGDKARAEELKAKFVDADDEFARIKQAIAERWLRAPRASFVYSVTM